MGSVNTKAIPRFEYGYLAETNAYVGQRFGGLFELPILASLYDEIASHHRTGNVLDVGAGRAKPLGKVLGNADLSDGRY